MADKSDMSIIVKVKRIAKDRRFIGAVIAAVVVYGSIVGYIDEYLRFPDIEAKRRQVEETFRQECSLSQLSGATLVSSEDRSPAWFLRKRVTTDLRSVYTVDKSWEEVRTYYYEKAYKYGWDIRSSGHYISLRKGKAGDAYSVSVHREKEEGIVRIEMSWIGIRSISINNILEQLPNSSGNAPGDKERQAK